MANKLGVLQQTVTKWFTSSPKNHRNIGDNAARLIEQTFELPRGWMDENHVKGELENSTEQKLEKMLQRGEGYRIPLTYNITLDQQLTVTFLEQIKGTVMLLSTDENAYALQLLGHNPTAWFSDSWGIIIEPDTPLTRNESALFHLNNGETVLRLVIHIGDDLYTVLNPITGQQENLPRSRITSTEYAYIGIPPSKIKREQPDDN